ncbi:MAG: sodium:solute symporter family protein [Calditrichaceae bacterium]|nr:sodium:solute symporter family protein [Calditrichaceae bacterium]RQV91986.1 MAG: sodium:solute symporter family protein [Calditrichota bacterium]
MDPSFSYWLGFGLYGVLVIFIGFYIWIKEKHQHKESDNQVFWQAGRNLSGIAVGLSISASMMSVSWSGVYGVQLFYWFGPGGAWLLIIPWLITMAGFFIMAPVFRKIHAFSQPALLTRRFGDKARKYLVLPLIFVFITWTGAEIYAAGIIISPLLQISLPVTLFLISLIVAAYSFTGGFEAVVSTDKIQFVLIALFMIIMVGIGINALPENLSIMNYPVPPKINSKSSLLGPGLALILITFMAYLPGWLTETDVWVRMQAARSDREARKGIGIAAINSFLFVGVLPMIIGLCALILYPPSGENVNTTLGEGELIFTTMMKNHASEWLSVLLSVGLIAAAMSTIDTCSNIVALTLSHDWLEPKLKNRWNARQLNHLARLISAAAVFISFIYALFTKSLWDIFYLSSGVLTTTVFIPVVSSFIKSTKRIQVLLAVIAGFSATFIFYFLELKGFLQNFEPAFIRETELGYILWGFLFSLAGFISGRFLKD